MGLLGSDFLMRPRRTTATDTVFRLPGGNEDNDLFIERAHSTEGDPLMVSYWEPTYEQREVIRRGGRVQLIVWGEVHPPVAMGVAEPV